MQLGGSVSKPKMYDGLCVLSEVDSSSLYGSASLGRRVWGLQMKDWDFTKLTFLWYY